MHVTRVVVEAPVTSFRHPFFVTGRQLTFDFPPPSTILGHCASALGKWPDLTTFFFGLHFTSRARGADLEHQHITTARPSRTKTLVSTKEGPVRATTEVTVQPVRHEELQDLFDKQFDGGEVVPLSKRAEYERRMEEDPLAAPGLRIPVSLGQIWGLRRKGRLVPSEGVLFADVHYSSTLGLDLTFPSQDDA